MTHLDPSTRPRRGQTCSTNSQRGISTREAQQPRPFTVLASTYCVSGSTLEMTRAVRPRSATTEWEPWKGIKRNGLKRSMSLGGHDGGCTSESQSRRREAVLGVLSRVGGHAAVPGLRLSSDVTVHFCSVMRLVAGWKVPPNDVGGQGLAAVTPMRPRQTRRPTRNRQANSWEVCCSAPGVPWGAYGIHDTTSFGVVILQSGHCPGSEVSCKSRWRHRPTDIQANRWARNRSCQEDRQGLFGCPQLEGYPWGRQVSARGGSSAMLQQHNIHWAAKTKRMAKAGENDSAQWHRLDTVSS